MSDAKRISIIGVGLLGGSIGLAAKAAGLAGRVVGFGHRASTLQSALEMGAIDEAATDVAAAARDADLVILCTPVGLFGEMLRGLAPALSPGAIVTDVGSTKRSVVELAHKHLPAPGRFVASHPMAGSEKRGVEFARTDLFEGAICLTTPTPDTDAAAIESVEAFWRKIGMRILRLTPVDHDRLLADVSHLPHAVAAALVSMQSEAALDLCGKGFLDTTRISSGDGGLWRDIFIDNRDNLKAGLRRLRDEMDALMKLLEDGKGEELRQWLDAAAKRREELLHRKLREIAPD